METSLRYSGDSKTLRIHANENFPIDSLTFFRVHGALDTSFGRPSYFSAILRHIYPDGLVSFHVKGRCNADQDFSKKDSKAAVEFTWNIFNLQKDQHVRFKVGYDIIDGVSRKAGRLFPFTYFIWSVAATLHAGKGK